MNNVDQILIGFVALLLFVVVFRVWTGRRNAAKNDFSGIKINEPGKLKAKVPKAPIPEPLVKKASAQPQPISQDALDEAEVAKGAEIEEPEDDEIDDPIELIKTFSAPVALRIRAMEKAANDQLTEAVPSLIEALYEPDPAISGAAAQSLGMIGDERAIEPLLEVARRNDVLLMKQFNNNSDNSRAEKAVEETPDSVSTDANPYNYKDMVVFKIDQLPQEYFQPDGSPVPRNELVIRGLKDNNQQLRQMAAKAAIGMASDEVIEPLIETLSNPYEVESVRFMAAEALGTMDDERSVGSLLNALKDDNVAVRYSAASALTGRKDPLVVEALVSAMSDSDKFVRSSVACALGETNDPSAIEALFRGAADESEIVRFSAAKALACFPFALISETVLQNLESIDKNTRLTMLDVLGQTKSNESTDILRRYLKSEDSEMSYRASLALMGLENIDVIDELIEASKRFDDELIRLVKTSNIDFGQESDGTEAPDQKSAARTIEEITDLPEGLENLRQNLMSDSPNIRGSAANTLGDFDSREAVELLASALADDNEFVRASAVSSLGRIAKFDALKLLVSCEKDPSEEVRYAVVKASGSINEPETISCLERMSKADRSKNVKRSARVALQKLTS